jgi:ribonuclease J
MQATGAEIAYIHTSGHVSASDLREFAAAIWLKMAVPVHGVQRDEESNGFGMVCRLADEETMEIP